MELGKTHYSLFIMCLIILIIPRIYYVETFAVALPFWDQWDSEWLGLLRPWATGKWDPTLLFAPHNEHRIVPTRLLTLLIYHLTGNWNNLNEARVNIPLSVFGPAILLWVLIKNNQLRGTDWLAAFTIILGSTLPFSWENFLIGFQSQFYFLNLLTVASLTLAAYRPTHAWSVAAIVFLSLLSTITMASGLLTPASVIVLTAVRCYVIRAVPVHSIILILSLLGISVLAYLQIPAVPEHHALHARNIFEFAKTANRLTGWPLRGSKAFLSLMWLPGLATVSILLIRRQFAKIDLLFLGCLAWSAMQIVALSYARGHDFAHMPPRYSEVLLLGLAGNAWFILKIPVVVAVRHRVIGWTVATAFYGVVTFSYIQRTVLDFRILKEEKVRRMTQTRNVCDYLSTGNFTTINKSGFEIPYPDAKKLQKILDDPEFRKAIIPTDLCKTP